MSDSRTGARSAGFGGLSDAKRVERFDADALFGPGFVKNEDGSWSPAVARALYINAENEIELRTDGVTLVQESASPTALKFNVPAAVTRAIAVVGANAQSAAARLTSSITSMLVRIGALEAAPPAHVHDGADITTGVIDPDRLGTGGGGATKFLREDGTYQTIAGGGDALTTGTLAQFAPTTSAEMRGVLSDETGTGVAVFNDGPTLIAPALGTPASGVLTNCTGTAAGLTAGAVTTNANLTGDVTSVGNAATIPANTVTLAQMADMATSSFLGRTGVGVGDPQVLSVATSKILLGLAGTNTGDQTITLTGGVTGSGTGSFAATVITNANLTGDVTSVGNAATIPTSVISTAARTVLDDASVSAMVDTLGGASSLGSGGLVRGTSPTITTPTIASFTNSTHTHTNAAGGGTLDGSAIAAGTVAIARLPTASSNRYVKAGTTNYVSLMVPGLASGVALSTKTLANGVAYAVPFIAPDRGGTLDQVEVYVTTGVGATNVRFGIYGNLGESSLYPGTLTIDCGAFTSTTSAQQRLASISQALTGGALYWFVIVSDGAPAIRGGSTNQASHLLGTTSIAATTWTTHLSATMAYGSLPGTFPTSGAAAVTGAFPVAGLRFSA